MKSSNFPNSKILLAYSEVIHYGAGEFYRRSDEKWHKIRILRPDLSEDELTRIWKQFPGSLDAFYRKLSRG